MSLHVRCGKTAASSVKMLPGIANSAALRSTATCMTISGN